MTHNTLGRLLSPLMPTLRRLLVFPLILAVLAGVICFVVPTTWSCRSMLEFPSLPSALDFITATDQSPSGLAAQLTGGGSDELKRCIAILESERVRQKVVEDPTLNEALQSIFGPSKTDDLMEAIKDQVNFSVRPGNMISIAATLPGPSRIAMYVLRRSPETTRKTVVALVQAYSDQLRSYLNNVSASNERAEREYIEPQVEHSYQRLQRLQAQQAALAGKGSPLPPDQERPMLSQALTTVEQQRATVGVDLASARQAKALARRRLEEVPENLPTLWQKTKNPEVDRLQALLTDSQTKYYLMRETEGKSDRHPDVRAELANIKQLEGKLREALRRPLSEASEQIARNPLYVSVQSAYNDALMAEATAQARATALTATREALYAQLRGLTGRQAQQMRLQGDYDVESAIYMTLRKALEQAKIREQRAAQIFVVLDSPRLPRHKTGPSLVRSVALGFIWGLILVIGWIEGSRWLANWTPAIVSHFTPAPEPTAPAPTGPAASEGAPPPEETKQR